MTSLQQSPTPELPPARLGPPKDRTLVLVGLMGVGKTSIGKRLAQALHLPFRDADSEIEAAAGRTIADIFAERGEAEFREGERRVISRLMEEPPHVLATGGGAFLRPETRALILQKVLAIWLKADLAVLARRVARKNTRPLLVGRDPLEVLTIQAEARYPIYAEAHVTVETGDVPHSAAVDAVIKAITDHARSARA